MPAEFILQAACVDIATNRICLNAELLHARIQQVTGKNVYLVVAHVRRHIFKIRVKGNREVCGYCPRRSRPDNNRDLFPAHGRNSVSYVRTDRKPDIYGRRCVIRIFHFRLSQSGLAGGTPVNRLFTLDQAAVCGEFSKLPHYSGNVGIVHGQVRPIPFAHHTKTFEFFLLNPHKTFGISPAQSPYPAYGHRFLFVAEFLIHIMFDRKAVAIPSRHIRGVKTAQLAGPDNSIFEYLVKSRAQMNIPVGIRRAVMKNKQRRAL